MLGIKYGYYPADAYQGWQVDSIIDSIGDLGNAIYKCFHIIDPEEQKAAFATFYETTYVKWLEAMQNRLKANGSQSHIVGDKWTIADFMMASLAYQTFINEHSPNRAVQLPIVEKYPDLLAYFKGLGEDLKGHLESRGASQW